MSRFYCIIWSSPIPGRFMPAARAWSLKSGLHGSEWALCCWTASACTSIMGVCATHVFQAVKVLVTLAAGFTAERLLLLHPQCSGVRSTGLRVDDGKGTVSILVQLLCLVTMCLVVPTTPSVCTLASGETPSWSSPAVGEGAAYLRPFWFLYAFSQPITGHLKGLCSSGIIILCRRCIRSLLAAGSFS